MTHTHKYLNEVRERDNDETIKPQIEIAYEAWTKRVYEEDSMLSTQFAFRNGYRAGFYASYRTDVPRLLAMIEFLMKRLETDCYCTQDTEFDGPGDTCANCIALKDIDLIARGELK